MPACERCWSEYKWRLETDGLVTYRRVVEERDKVGGCTPEEQCGEMHLLVDWTDRPRQCRCGKRLEESEGAG